MRATRPWMLLAALAAALLLLAACEADEEEAAEEEPDDDEIAVDFDDDDADDPDDDVDEDDEPAEDDDEPADELDVEAEVDAYASTLPDGWLMFREADELEEIREVEGSVVVDVRQPEEFEEGHIPGAVSIPLRELADNLNHIPTDVPVAVHCQAGWRAGIATAALGLMGYDNVEAWNNDFPAWEEAGYEVEAGEPEEPEDFGEPELAEPEMVDEVGAWLAGLPEGWLAIGDPAEVADALDAGAQVVDNRGEDDFEESHVEDALNIPIRELGARHDELPTDVDLIFHCGSGWRCAMAMPMLGVLGYDNVSGFPGMFDDLADEGLTT